LRGSNEASYPASLARCLMLWVWWSILYSRSWPELPTILAIWSSLNLISGLLSLARYSVNFSHFHDISSISSFIKLFFMQLDFPWIHWPVPRQALLLQRRCQRAEDPTSISIAFWFFLNFTIFLASSSSSIIISFVLFFTACFSYSFVVTIVAIGSSFHIQGITTGFTGSGALCRDPVKAMVYARHGRELMGWKSPIRESC